MGNGGFGRTSPLIIGCNRHVHLGFIGSDVVTRPVRLRNVFVRLRGNRSPDGVPGGRAMVIPPKGAVAALLATSRLNR